MNNPLKKSGGKHWIANRAIEIPVGILLFIIGCMLIYDAFDARGRKMPWPAGGMAPW